MTSRRISEMTVNRTRHAMLGALLLWLALPAAALYKVVGPDGSITYTDRPPSDGGGRVSTMGSDAAVGAPSPQDRLPLALRQISERYPVTLYSARDCPPCDEGRALLVQRGVPFAEKLVASDDDAAALERAIGVRTVPSLTIGKQVLRGLSQPEWSAYLDAAGYPRESGLPRNWQQAEATPLVARQTPRSTSPERASAASAPAAAAPLPSAPSGLRF